MIFKRSGGVLVGLTSFPGPYGIGDMGKGAHDFVDFLKYAGQRLWQILPLGPTSYGDSPYQSFSTFAGNPLLISPDLLVEEGYLSQEDLKEIPDFDPYAVDYGKVLKYKTGLFNKAYENFQNSATENQTVCYRNFCERNKFWLDDYALFMSLKEYFLEERSQTADTPELIKFKTDNKKYVTESTADDMFYGAAWQSWPKDIREHKEAAVAEYTKLLSKEIGYHKFLQFEFFRQWFELKKYANSLDISIIGDIPIFVAMDSADVWASRHLFRFNRSGYPTEIAGVPPDYFSSSGQLWGNPTYNWKTHKEEGFDWWIKRISYTLELTDILRIDHFRGFEANWCVPFGAEDAVKGKWRKGPGVALFDAVKAKLGGSLPIIAEDLGIITEEVEELRGKTGLPGMRVLQFAFGDTSENPYLPHNYLTSNTVVYTGTHDNDTSIGWYNTATEYEKDHFRRYSNISGEEPNWDMIRLAMSSVANLALFPIQDLLSLDSTARTNTPGVATGNWQFRYTEDMLNLSIAQRLVYLNCLFNRNNPECLAKNNK